MLQQPDPLKRNSGTAEEGLVTPSSQYRTAVAYHSRGSTDANDVSDADDKSYETNYTSASVNGNRRKCKTALIRSSLSTDYSDLDTGWAWLVLFACFCTFFLVGNSIYSTGIVQLALLDRYGESVSLTSWTGALHTSASLFAGPVSSAIINRFSCRTALVLAGVLYVIGLLATAVAPNIKVAILTFGIIAGVGGGIAYTAVMIVVGFYFRRKRNLAMGIAGAGMGAGLFVLAPLLQMYRNEYGTTAFFILSAGVMAHIIAFGMLCRPSKLERYAQDTRHAEAMDKRTEDKNCISILKENSYTHVLLHKGVLCLCVSHFMAALGVCMLYVHLPSFMVHCGIPVVTTSFFISLTGIMSLIGRFLAGAIANIKHVHEIYVFAGTILINALATLFYPFTSEHLAGHVVFTTIFGLFYGCYTVVTTSVSIKMVAIQFVPTAVGLQFLFGGVGALVGPVLAGFVVDYGGSYKQAFVLAGFFDLLASILGAVSVCFKSPQQSCVLEMKQ